MEDKKVSNFGTTVKTGLCRCSFPKLVEPDSSTYGQGKYSIDAIYESEEEMEGLVKSCEGLAMRIYGTTTGIVFPWRDGDTNNKIKYQGYAGKKFIVSKRNPKGVKHPLTFVGPNPANQIDPSEFYSGCYIKVNVTPFAYTKKEKIREKLADGSFKDSELVVNGVTTILNAVQFVKDGPCFSGEGDPTGGFSDVSNEEDLF